MARLGDVCAVLNGFAFKSDQYVKSGIRIVRIANVQKGYIEDSSPAFYSMDNIEANKYQLKENDLLMSLTGNVGRVGLLTSNFLPAALNQRVACLRIKDSSILEKAYLFHVLNSDFFEQKCIGSANGVAQKNISTEWLKEYEIPLPPLDAQRHIAAVLDKISDLIAKRRRQLNKLDELVKSRFVEMFGDCDLSKAQTSWMPIKDIGTVAGGATPKTEQEEFWGGPYRWITPAELEADSGYIFDSVRKLTKAGVESCSLQEMPTGTVLLSSRAPIGKLAIAGNPFYCNQGFKNIICNETIIPRYLYTLLLLNVDYLNSLGRGATFKEISKTIVENICIPVPPLDLQNRFAAFVAQTDKTKTAVQKSLEKLEILKKSLMQEYFG